MSTKKLLETRTNHGTSNSVILKLVIEQDVSISIDNIVDMINADGCASDTMAKLINALGKVNEKYQITTARSIDDLDDAGRQFIHDMIYFMQEEDK